MGTEVGTEHEVRIPLRDELTVADRVGTVPEWTLAIVGILSCAVAIALGRREATKAKGQQ